LKSNREMELNMLSTSAHAHHRTQHTLKFSFDTMGRRCGKRRI
jgi:hypothetical protein